MTDLENRIYKEIANANGIKGSEIAARLGVEKGLVNSVLYSSYALKALVRQDRSTYKWYVIANSSHSSVKQVSLPEPDKDLRDICNYYLSCLSMESGSSVSQFLKSNYSLRYAPLNGLGINPEVDHSAILLLNKINVNRDSKAYLGYPIRIYTVYGKGGIPYSKIAPVFLFPVDYTGGKVTISWVPSVNMEVLKGYSESDIDSITVELVNLETELGMNSPDTDIEVDELVLRLKEIRQWDWAEPIDPYNIPKAVDLSEFSDGIYNRPIIIEAEREKYTQGLEAELMALANMPEENYKGTALYSWVKGIRSSNNTDEIKPLLEVLPLNSEQAQAVETALSSDLTIVTGPPGTGKSQVVTDLLVNIVWNGKSALFSSKNNKAVDVVDLRVNGLCKRPILLRMGSDQHISRLAEIIEGLLITKPSDSDKSDMEFYMAEYNRLNNEANKLKVKKMAIVKERNLLDSLEQKYCTVRSCFENCFDIIGELDGSKIQTAAQAFKNAYYRAIKQNNGIFARLFWPSVRKKRVAERNICAETYNRLSQKYLLDPARDDMAAEDVEKLYEAAVAFNKALSIAIEYKKALNRFKILESLESIDKDLADNKARLADVAYKLWDKWLTSQAVSLTYAERQEMSNFLAMIKLAGDIDISHNPEIRKRYSKVLKQMTKYLQCWAVTSLSAKSRVPFTAGLFDYVIIDEASQCDIASILPLL